MRMFSRLNYLLPVLLFIATTTISAEEEEPKPAEPQYLKLHPAFIVNLANSRKSHYLQIEIQVMSRETEQIEAVKHHLPAIRHNLLMLFSEQSRQDVKTPEGKKKLMASALSGIKKILKEETGKDNIEAVYFTSFVIQ